MTILLLENDLGTNSSRTSSIVIAVYEPIEEKYIDVMWTPSSVYQWTRTVVSVNHISADQCDRAARVAFCKKTHFAGW